FDVRHRVFRRDHVDRLSARTLIQPKPEILSRDNNVPSSLDKVGLFDLGVRKELAGFTLAVVEENVDVCRAGGLKVNLKIVPRTEHAALAHQDLGVAAVSLFSLSDEIHPERKRPGAG